MALPEAPNSRSEQYLAKIAGQNTAIPEAPNSRVEQYLDYIAENGTVSKEEIAEQVSDWLEENIHEDPTVVIDTSLSASGAAADAKATGDVIELLRLTANDTAYGIPPFMMSLFKKTANMFSDFDNFISGSYYGNNSTGMVVKKANSWKGWLIRVKPDTTYTIGPVDYKIMFFKSDFTTDKQINLTDLSTTEPSVITSGSSSAWMALTQSIGRDMSSWMMVEGDTYPSTYASGYPQWVDEPKLPDSQLNHVTFAYNAANLTVTHDGTSTTVFIPGSTRILTSKGFIMTTETDTTITTTNAQFVAYDTTDDTWKFGNTSSGHEKYYIGWVRPKNKTCFLLAKYDEINQKTIAFMGDSITAGVATDKCFHEYLHDMYGFTCLNYGYGGSGYYWSYAGTSSGKIGMGLPGRGENTTAENAFTPNTVVARLSELDADNLDAIVIFAGTNDWGHSVTVNNLISGIDSALEYCATNLPAIPVLVITPVHRRYDTVPNEQSKTLREYSDIIIEECKKYGVAYVDTMTMSGLYPDNEANRFRYFEANQDSGLHPSAEGHKRIAVSIGEMLKEMVRYSDLD